MVVLYFEITLSGTNEYERPTVMEHNIWVGARHIYI